MRRWRSPELAALSCCAVSRMLQRTLNHRHASHFMAWITTTRIPRPLGARSKSLLLLPATKMEICTSALFLMASRCLVIQTAFAVVWLALRRTGRANSPPPLRCPVIVLSRRWLIIARPHSPRMAAHCTSQSIVSPLKYALSLPRTYARLIARRFAAKPAQRYLIRDRLPIIHWQRSLTTPPVAHQRSALMATFTLECSKPILPATTIVAGYYISMHG